MQIKNIIYLALSVIFNLMIGVFIVPLLSWITTPVELGLINYNTNILIILLVLLSFGYDQLYIREYNDNQGSNFLFFCIVRTTLLYLAFLPIIYLFIHEYIWLYLISYTAVIIRYISLVPRMQQKMKLFSFLSLMPKVYTIIIIALLFFLQKKVNLTYYLWIVFSVNILVICTSLFFLDFKGQCKEKIELKEFDSFVYSIFMTLSIIAYYFLITSSYWVLNIQSKTLDMAYLGLIISLGAILGVLQSVFSIMYAPMVFRTNGEKSELAFNLVGLCSVFLLLISGIFSPLIKYLIPVIYHDLISYIFMGFYIPILYVFNEVYSVNLNLYKKNNYIMVSNFASVIIQCVLYYIFWDNLNYIVCVNILVFSVTISIFLKSIFCKKISANNIKFFNKFSVLLFIFYLFLMIFDGNYILYFIFYVVSVVICRYEMAQVFKLILSKFAELKRV